MPDFRVPPLNVGERVYRALLHVYPARFRTEFSEALIETFRDQRRAALRDGTPALLFWIAVLRDVLTQAIAEWFATLGPRQLDNSNNRETVMSGVWQAFHPANARVALRRLARVPSFSLAVIVVFALGIAAATAVFSLVDGVLLRPLPYAQPERLVAIGNTIEVGGVGKVDESDASILYFQEHASTLDGVAASHDVDVTIRPTTGEAARAERVASDGVTANLFDVLGVHAAHGRTFRTGEDRANSPKVAILSDGFWRRRFGGDNAIVGKRLLVDGDSYEIVGVMPAGFAYPAPSTELWTPIPLDHAKATAGSFNYRGIARLRPTVTPEKVRADLNTLTAHILDEFPNDVPPAMWEQAHVRATVVPLRDAIVGDVTHLLWILLGSVSLLLIIGCANVANLFLVRAEGRQLELAVRSALGAGLGGIIAELVSEGLVLAACGGLVGVLLAFAGVKLGTMFGGDLGVPRLQEVGVSTPVFLFAIGLTLFCAMFVSVVPILRARRVPVAMVLRESGRGSTHGARRQWTRNALVVTQIALGLVLVAVSGLLARSFARLRDVKPGFDASGIVMARVAVPPAAYSSAPKIATLLDRALQGARALPGVRDATLTDWVPLTNDHNDSVVGVEDHPLPPNAVPRVHELPSVDASYFHVMGVPILAGRTFGETGVARPSLEVVVSHAFAERYWPGGNPIGKRLRPGLHGPWRTIVGEVGDVHFDALDQPVNDVIYSPMVRAEGDSGQAYASRYVTLFVKSDRDGAAVSADIRNMIRALDPALATYDEHPLMTVVAAASSRARVTLILLALASSIALLLGAVGVYGVMAYAVSLRQREMGLRIALGARPADVRRMVSRQGLTLGAIGVVVGVIVAVSITRLLRGLLYDVSPTDPATLIATSGVLLIVALGASWIPARRAARADPAEALRAS